MEWKKIHKIQISQLNYPSLDNASFNEAITEYADFNIKGAVYTPSSEKEVIRLADKLCSSDIELSTYQTVVRNFLANDTPYNGLLLYHGLGTGKTCSAITISEAHRKFLKQSGEGKYIYVLGGPNIKSNFRKQLFDASHLVEVGGEWTCKSCVGNALLREVNPSGAKINKEDLVILIDELIHTYYRFMGYIKFANLVVLSKQSKDPTTRKRSIEKKYGNCMIIIDEVHNIKEDDDPKKFTPSKALDLITKNTTVKLLLLSATPMFNAPSEIVWITNLLNQNDNRERIYRDDFFDKYDKLVDKSIIDHLRGYVSFVKGENPFTFPFRVYPNYFGTLDVALPTKAANGHDIKPLKTIVYPVQIIDNQADTYMAAAAGQEELEVLENTLLGSLNMTYPGKSNELMNVMDKVNGKYIYKSKKERCFEYEHLKKYSAKIHSICTQCLFTSQEPDSEGIIMIYSRFIEKGVIPMALALESMGYHNKDGNLLQDRKNELPQKLYYCILTGKTPNNAKNIAFINSAENQSGNVIKIAIITEAASEGVDLKNIRQIHIMDPWWHLNRNEQIIGRGIRLCSHKNLPFEKRNAQIFLYVSVLNETELVDHYYYRFSENKAKNVGEVTRLLKQNAMDCIMNHEQFKSTESMKKVIKNGVKQILSNKKSIRYHIGDTSFSVLCDSMETCEYKCAYKELPISKEGILFDVHRTVEQIRNLFRIGYAYTTPDLFRELNKRNVVSHPQLYEALSRLVDLRLECRDMLHRRGFIINYGNYYLFQPVQLNEGVPVYQRRIPVNETTYSIRIKPSKPPVEIDKTKLIEVMHNNYLRAILPANKVNGKEWYDLVPIAKRHLQTTFEKRKIKFEEVIFNQCIIDHIIELLLHKECLELITYLFSTKLSEFETKLHDYFVFEKDILCLWDDKQLVFFKRNHWDIPYAQQKRKEIGSFGTVVGGITNDNKGGRVFKSKDMNAKGITYGQVCADAAKKSVPRIITVFGEPEATYQKFSSKEICCELELLLRYLNKIQYEKKRWFLSAIEVIDESKRGVLNLIKT